MTITIPPQLVDASASEKLAWVVLSESGPLTVPELAENSGLSETGVYNVVAELQRRGVVEKRPVPPHPDERCRNLYCASHNADTK